MVLTCLTMGLLLTGRADAATVAPSMSGVYVGGGNTSAFTSFSTWLGVHQSYVLDFVSSESWDSIDNPTWFVNQWNGSGARLVLSVPMLPSSHATLAQGATGAYNSNFRALAEQLLAAGAGNTIVRLGWEMNGNWFPWSIQRGNAGNYAAYWRQIVDTMRLVSPNFQFDFCPNDGSSHDNGVALNPESAYPGDAYVNYIGLDVYDESWVPGSSVEANRWTGYVNQPYGLTWQRTFAAAHDKPVTFPEWGLWPSATNGGGDSPAFVQNMYDWMSHSNLAYQMYFNASTSVLASYPKSQALYKQLFTRTASTTSVAATNPVQKRTTRPTPSAHRTVDGRVARSTRRHPKRHVRVAKRSKAHLKHRRRHRRAVPHPKHHAQVKA